jgi:hypothetical protein
MAEIVGPLYSQSAFSFPGLFWLCRFQVRTVLPALIVRFPV